MGGAAVQHVRGRPGPAPRGIGGPARQLPAGAIVADAILDLLRIEQLELCPWALREGVILRRIDMLAHGLDVISSADGSPTASRSAG